MKITVEFEEEPTEVIPGYTIMLICVLTVVISVVLIYSRHKKIK